MKDRAGPIAVLGAFVLSRLVFHYAGVRFDASSLPRFWQFLDPSLLATDLLRSVFYLHSQPPLFNLFVGLVLKVSPQHATAVFAALYHLFGAALAVMLYLLLARLGSGRALAAVLAILFAVSPAAILYESWLFYTYPLAAGLLAAAFFLHRFIERRRALDAVFFFALLAAVALTWSVFHLVWVAFWAVFLVTLVSQHDRRRAALLGAAALLVVGALYVKNWIVFGGFTASSWGGMSLAKLTLHVAPAELRRSLVDAGLLSPLALVPPFSPVEAYPPSYTQSQPTSIPALDRREKAPGLPNFNHLAYVEISRQYARDSRAMIARHPAIYARSVGLAGATYAVPASHYKFLRPNRAHIRRWADAYDRWVLGAFAAGSDERCTDLRVPGCLRRNAAYGWMGLAVVATAAGLGRGVAGVRRSRSANAAAAALLFLSLNILYVSVLGNLAELGENNRFRFVIDPLILVLAGALVAVIRARALRSAGHRDAGSALRPPD